MGSAAYSNFGDPERFSTSEPKESSHHAQGAERELPNRLVRAVQTARRRRAALFDADLFSDPVWDILLELYALHVEQRRASVSSLYVASGVPASTALRWIAKLEKDDLVALTDDPLDARRSWIELTADGLERMRRFFEMLPLAAISV